MCSTKNPEVELASSFGHRHMPMIGFGTAAMSPDRSYTKEAVLEAIKSGYRHFDTSTVYETERAIGEAVNEALQLGVIGSRDDVFITSKLWINENHPHLVIPAIKKSLRNLQLEYLDLYSIHWPVSTKPESPRSPIEAINVVPFDLKGVWTAMEECQRLGLTKAIGVCNFSRKKLDHLLSFAAIPPSVNQVEMNPTWQQKELVKFCKGKRIVITAYSPLGAYGNIWGTQDVMDNEMLKEIATTRGKSVAQVCLRWLYEQGVTFIVKSYNKERMKQNLEILDWCLTEDDYEKINQIKQKRTNDGRNRNLSPDDLWDGED